MHGSGTYTDKAGRGWRQLKPCCKCLVSVIEHQLRETAFNSQSFAFNLKLRPYNKAGRRWTGDFYNNTGPGRGVQVDPGLTPA